MSGYLWKYYLEDDVESFRHLLAGAPFHGRPLAPRANTAAQPGQASPAAFIGSPGSFGTSPTVTTRTRRDFGGTPRPGTALTRADVNSKDANGLTVLHHAASSDSDNALSFATALLEHSLTDLYAQDFENGWTALHRAFYFGNVAIARSIIDRDVLDALGHGSSGVVQHAGGLVKVKDKEGNGPLDLFATTIADRTLRPEEDSRVDAPGEEDDDFGFDDSGDGEDRPARRKLAPVMDIHGDELFTFGSNRNVTLGFGDEDDRQFPERIILRRPDHLLRRFYREHLERKQQDWSNLDASVSDLSQLASIKSMPVSDLPTIIRSTPLLIQDVHMSKLSTAVLTTDPESNLYMCGHGPGGRLGTGDETTRFQFVCIEGGALAKKKVIAVALGQNHSLALSDEGEIFSWGNNAYGQLGYSLPKTLNNEDPVQLLPRQIFGPLKKEAVIGVAASRIHSVAHTSSSLYTFGKNEGQLGIVDSDARSLEFQVTPRKVAASLFSSPIRSVSAIERATVCLLENHEVWVFANYGYAKVSFPLEGFSNYFLKQSFLTTKYDTTPNRICKVTAGGDNICALSTNGEIYTVAVSKRSESGQDSTASTTNPSKIRGALSQSYTIWSLKKGYMAARDVDVDQDGSVILTTEAGTVWRRVKRAKIKDATASGTGEYRPKDYKFLRVAGLTRVTAVRASAFGAYAAVRKDCDVTKTQVQVDSPTLWDDVFALLPFGDLATQDDELDDDVQASEVQLLTRRALESEDFERDLKDALFGIDEDDETLDMVIGSTVSDIRIPVHGWIFAGRSKVLRHGLAEFRHSGSFSLPEVLSLEKDDRGRPLLILQGMEVLTMFNFVLYAYTDNVVDFWHYTRQYPKLAFRYRQVRTELMKLSSKLELKQLEPAVRQMVRPKRSLTADLELAISDPSFFEDGDVILELADSELKVHSALMVQRCPFFEGMFKGRAAGLWLAGRREASTDPSEAIRIDLKHIELRIFELVLRHLYADTGDEMFDDFVSDNLGEFLALNEFLDHVMDVLSVANELMLDRLSQVCQQVVGRYVNVRNICQLLNAISPCSVTEFKDAGLEYICLSLEAVLQNGVLDELDEDLILDLDQVVRENQVACLPIAKSGRAEALLFEKYPELAEQIDRRRRAKVDAIMLQSKYAESSARMSSSLRAGSYDDQPSPMQQKARRRSAKDFKATPESPTLAPALKGKGSVADMMFDMDDDVDSENDELDLGAPRSIKSPTAALGGPVQDISLGGAPTSSPWQIPKTAARRDASDSAIASPSSPTPRSLATPLDTITTPIARTADKPWGTAPLQTSKLDMKDIMAETSTTQPSNISLALSAQAKDDRSPGPFAAAKLSQKERKKLQQQQASKAEASTASPSSNEPRPAASPWQMKPPAAKVALTDVMSSTSPTPTQQQPQQKQQPSTITRPNLTMRQTIANNGPASKAKLTNAIPAASTPVPSLPQPSPSSSNNTKNANVTPSSGKGFAIPRPDAPSSSASAVPQSIRHIAPHSEASLLHLSGLGMADILSMQQAEKDTIAAAAAERRSLQEIQQEQEFQEWWDKESRRVMEEEKERQRREKNKDAGAGGSISSKKKSSGKKAKGEHVVEPGGRGGEDGAKGTATASSAKSGVTAAKREGGGGGGRRGGALSSGGGTTGGKKGNAVGPGPAPDTGLAPGHASCHSAGTASSAITTATTADATTTSTTATSTATGTTTTKPSSAKPNRKHKSSGKPGKQQQEQQPSVTTTTTTTTTATHPRSSYSFPSSFGAATTHANPAAASMAATTAVTGTSATEKTPPAGPAAARKQHHHPRPRGGGAGGGGPGKRQQPQSQSQSQSQQQQHPGGHVAHHQQQQHHQSRPHHPPTTA